MTPAAPARGQRPNRRQERKLATRLSIQDHARRLFLAHGYDATTVEQIAEAAGISHMTFFRHFPTKESVVADDDYDPVIAQLIAARPAAEPALAAIHHALVSALRAMPPAEAETVRVRTRLMMQTPALRARLWENQFNTVELFARALAARGHPPGDPEDSGADEAAAGGSPGETCPADDDPGFELRVQAGAALAALTAALTAWAAADRPASLPDLVDQAFTALNA